MARPKNRYPDLPRYVTARNGPAGLRYYFQKNGEKVPLGSDRAKALRLAELVSAGGATLDEARLGEVGLLTDAEIVSRAVPLKREPGIYFLIAGDRIVYIGQSTDVFARIRQHQRARRFDGFAWFPCPAHELVETEKTLILKFRPPQNTANLRTELRTKNADTQQFNDLPQSA